MRRRLLQVLTSALLAAVGLLGSIGPLPADEPILVVRNLADPQRPEVQLTEAELEGMPQATVRTHTEFTDGVVEFVGPLARDVIARVGTDGAANVHAVAVNDYSVDIPLEDFFEYDVILAMSADGRRLTMRDKGPLWIMYPIDEHDELDDAIYNQRLIWQLTTLELM